MVKLRKQRRMKKFRYNINRKRVNKKQISTGKVSDPSVRKFWEHTKSAVKNIDDMGLSADPNKTVPIPSTKKDRLKIVKLVNGFIEEDMVIDVSCKQNNRPKAFIAESIEEDAKAPRESRLRLPKGVVENLSYFLDNYKFDYKEMVRDRKNYNQWTWRQFKAKIKKFMGIPAQFNEYLNSRNLDMNNLNWVESTSDDE